MVTREEILQGRDASHPLSEVMESNLAQLLEAVNKLRIAYGKPMVVNSGYRPAGYNKAIGGAPNSAHITCEAVDFKDKDGEIKKFCTLERLKEYGLWMEHPSATPSWCHVDIRPRGNRVFKP